jgi:Meckel syndrome type 1 protein
MTGTVQLPLSAIAPLRQGSSPLFIPLAHVTLEGEGLRAMTKSFVIGTPSSAGRVHPIPLDQPPGAIAGLAAQPIAIPPVSAGT